MGTSDVVGRLARELPNALLWQGSRPLRRWDRSARGLACYVLVSTSTGGFVKQRRRARLRLWLSLIAGCWLQWLWSEARFWFCRSKGLSLR
jgi:hypothetical protein